MNLVLYPPQYDLLYSEERTYKKPEMKKNTGIWKPCNRSIQHAMG